jgi:hypothetical protein
VVVELVTGRLRSFSTGNMIAKGVDGKFFATTNRECQLRKGRYFRTDKSGKECLSETIRLNLM